MSLKVFFELVEIKAKVASVAPFLLGLFYSIFVYHHTNPLLALVFFIAMFLYNMVVDMLDNYSDYYRADSKSYQQKTNIIGREQIDPKLVLRLMWIFTIISALLGLWLVNESGIAVLWLGMFCFAIGYLYSSGPLPISNLPLGELVSGFTMGFVIILLSVYLNGYQVFSWNFTSIMNVFMLALPLELWISNLMLANNLCDAQEDEDNHRKTIIHFIGKKVGIWAFSLKNVVVFIVLMLLPVLGIAPKTVWASIIIVPFVYQQNKLLAIKQVKTETFITAVKILLVGALAYVITYLVGILI